MIAVNSGVMGIFIFNFCSTTGKNDRHRAPFSVLFHWLSFYEPLLVYFGGHSCCRNPVVYYVLVILTLGRLFGEFIRRLVALDSDVSFHRPEVNSPI